MKIFRRMLASFIFILLTTWFALGILIYFFQERLIFFPKKEITQTPADIGLSHEEIFLGNADGSRIHGWFIEHEEPRATMLFLHGNAGNISNRLDSIALFHRLGLSIFIIDYRGYGLSSSRPSEHGSYQDAEAAWHYLRNVRGISAMKILIFGRSLGGGPAGWLASRYRAGALVLESTFTSIVDMGQQQYPYLPVRWLARVKYPTIDRLNVIFTPVMIIHSSEDELIPYDHGLKLYAAANQPKSLLTITGGHNGGFLDSGEIYTKGLSTFITQHLQQARSEEFN